MLTYFHSHHLEALPTCPLPSYCFYICFELPYCLHSLVPNYMPGALHSVKFSGGSPESIRWEHHGDGGRALLLPQCTCLDSSWYLFSVPLLGANHVTASFTN